MALSKKRDATAKGTSYPMESERRPRSLELSTTAIFTALLTMVELLCYNLTWPMLPPIVITPFITCLILAISIPFSKGQWIMGLVASLIVNLSKGGFLPGPFIIPVYGFLFQIRRVKIAGASSAITHMVYGVFLAPMIFAVAPAKIVYGWVLAYVGSFVPAILIMGLIYGVGGVAAAVVGHGIGVRIAHNIRKGAYYDS